MPFKVMHRKEVTHSNGSYERKSRGQKLADEMGRAKNPMILSLTDAPEESDLWLHESYFRLMTIKHAISKIEWAIKWALDYYIAQSRQKSRQLEFQAVAVRAGVGVIERGVVGKPHPAEPWWSLGTREVAD